MTERGQQESAGNVIAPSGGIARAMAVLELLTREGPQRFGELQSQLALPKGSLHRLLRELEDERLVSTDVHGHLWSPGFRLLELASRVWQRSDLRTLAHETLEALCEDCGESVQLAVLADDKAVYIDALEGSDNVRMAMSIGSLVPLYCSAVGKALLAHLPVTQQNALIERLAFVDYTTHTITCPKQLRKELNRVRQQGYAEDREEHFTGICCVAAPVFDAETRIVAAISISAPSYRIQSGQIQHWQERVTLAARTITARLSPQTAS